MCACSFTNVCQRARERERERVERHIHTVINVCVFHMEQNNTISFKNTHVPIIWEYISLQSHSFIIYTGIVHVYIKSEKGERHYRRKCHQMIFFFFFSHHYVTLRRLCMQRPAPFWFCACFWFINHPHSFPIIAETVTTAYHTKIIINNNKMGPTHRKKNHTPHTNQQILNSDNYKSNSLPQYYI